MPNIELAHNGPYLVHNVSELILKDGTVKETKAKFALCRCGESSNKPFCDGTHKKIGFDSERRIKRDLTRKREYSGDQNAHVKVEDHRSVCAHAGFCVDRLPSVFKRQGHPWVEPDADSVEAIREVVEACPSGALSLHVESDRETESKIHPSIEIVAGGPYHVTGEIELRVDKSIVPPVPNRYALCRCGASKNKPYCDGSHYELDKGWDE